MLEFLFLTVLAAAVYVLAMAPSRRRRLLSLAAVLLCLLVLPGAVQATGQITTLNADGSVTVTDLGTGLSFIQPAGVGFHASGFYSSGFYGFGPSITVSRFGRLSAFPAPLVVPGPAVVAPAPFFRQRAVFVDRFGRVVVR